MSEQEPREGQAEIPEIQRKVAICGFAESYKLAPFDDPTVEIWGLNELWKYVPRWTRWFELHDAETLGITKRDLSEGEEKRHLAWLSRPSEGKPIYMQPQFCDGRFPAAVPLPLERLIETFGRYFTSTIGYMVGLAILEGFPWIGLYGIDLASDVEYPYQRPNTEYLIGIARGQGKTVVVPESAAILKAGHLYGYEKAIGDDGNLSVAIRNHKATLVKKHEETLATLNTLDGAIQESDNFLKLMQYKERGAAVTGY